MTKTDPISAATAYRMALEVIARAPSLSSAVRQAQHALTISFTPPDQGQISISSGYGQHTRKPFITVSLSNPSESANPTIQMTSEQAREQAHYILEAADAAESDGFIVEWLRDKADLNDGQIATMLAEFRAFRDQHRSK